MIIDGLLSSWIVAELGLVEVSLASVLQAASLVFIRDRKRGFTMCQPEATGTCKNNQGKGKVIKVLGAVASIAVGVALLPFK